MKGQKQNIIQLFLCYKVWEYKKLFVEKNLIRVFYLIINFKKTWICLPPSMQSLPPIPLSSNFTLSHLVTLVAGVQANWQQEAID